MGGPGVFGQGFDSGKEFPGLNLLNHLGFRV